MNTLRKGLIFGLTALLGLALLAWAMPAGAEGQNGTTLTASKTATAHLVRTFHWTIDKSVTPDTWNLFRGDSGTSQYTISVTKDAGTLEAYIDGEICVNNGGAVATENLQIVDRVTMPPSTTVIASSNVDLSAHPVLQPAETYCYPYRVDIPSGSVVAGATYKDTADITITNHSGHLGTPFGPNPSATSVMPSSPTLVNDTINVDDSNGGTWPFSDSGSTSYTRTFSCDGDAGTHNNTATIRETGQSDSASVSVNCYALSVTKTAQTALTRTWSWTIDKSADKSDLLLATGQSFMVNYSVTVNASSPVDSNFAASGSISVSNPAPIAATINSVADVISGGINATVNCGVAFPYTLAAGGSLSCTYSASLPDASDRTNTATAALQNYSYNYDSTATAGGTTGFSGTAAVSFASPTVTKVHECIDVNDSFAAALGHVCAVNAPYTFTYSRQVGPYATCGVYTVNNTANFVASDDSGYTGSDSWTVNVTVPCNTGCTLTQGYWKTHSEFGPAPYDDTWAQLPNGASTTFFLSGKSYYQVMWTAPAGNAYYILADQYIAAKLNKLNGAATTPQVDAAMSWATTFFQTYTPSSSLSKTLRAQVISYAAVLESYNTGATGPGHCSE